MVKNSIKSSQKKVASINTSWDDSSKWYKKIVSNEGHYFHQHGLLETAKSLLSLNTNSRILDVGCGQGVFLSAIKDFQSYLGIDLSSKLISEAKIKFRSEKRSTFLVADASKNINIEDQSFTHALMMLSFQNMENGEAVIRNISDHLESSGNLVMVLNHPCFRIPRQSGWDVREANKEQRRWIAKYHSYLKIPVTTNPGLVNSPLTWSFHYPLEMIIEFLIKNNFVVTNLREVYSDKKSEGKYRQMENRSRNEIPLFMIIKAKKI